MFTARAVAGERLVVTVNGVERARSLPLEGSQGSVSLDPAHTSLRDGHWWALARVELSRESAAGARSPIGALAVVHPRGLSVARACALAAALAPTVLALLALVAARALSARSLSVQLAEALVTAAPLALGARVWARRPRWILAFHAPSAMAAVILAWGLFFASRAQNLVVHNVTGAAQIAQRIPMGRSAWLARDLPMEATACVRNGPVCLQSDPRSLLPAACGDAPEEEPLVRVNHAVRFLGCPSRYEVFSAGLVRDPSLCQRPIRGGVCCLDLRGPECRAPRSVAVELPWPAGSPPRGSDPATRCPTRELTPFRVRMTATTGAASELSHASETPAGEELCVDLERWGSAHEIIIEDGARTWRAARAPDPRPRAMRVLLPRIERPREASLRVAYTVREGDSAAIALERTHHGLEGGLWLPTTVRFDAGPRAGARASLSGVELGPRARDAIPAWEARVGPGRPALHAELWPGLPCGATLLVRDEGDHPRGSVTLPCPEPGRRERGDLPWVLWRFALRESMPAPWREAARVVSDDFTGRIVRFRADETPSEVFVAYRGWDGVSVDLRLYTREPRTLGIEPDGDGRWRLFAGPPPPRSNVCCQLDGVWSVCPAEFNDYWRCEATVSGRPSCAEAFARCTFIDWAAERAAAARSQAR